MRYRDKYCKPLFALVLCAMLMMSPITVFAVTSPIAVDETETSVAEDEADSSVLVDETDSSAAVEETDSSAAVEETDSSAAVEETDTPAAVEETDSSVAVDEIDTPAAIAGTDFPVAVDETNFPDVAWREYVNTNFAGGDYVLTRAEAEAVVSIEVSNMGITDLSGVEYFANIESLYCIWNSLTFLDVTGLANLQVLQCSANSLTSLDVTGLANLQALQCGANSLTSLNVAGLANLQELLCNENSLASFDMAGLTGLLNFDCSFNPLISLNVTGLTNLRFLLCQQNSLTSLDVAGLVNLEAIVCTYNSLTSLNVTGLANLKAIYCSDNSLLEIVGGSNLIISGTSQTRTISMISDGEGRYVSTDTYPLQTTSHLSGLSTDVTYDAETGLFHADNVPITSPFSTSLQSGGSPVSGTLSFSHTDSVLISRPPPSVNKGSTQQFTAAVDIADDTEKKVIWSVSGGTDSTIDSNGLLSVGRNETAATLTITATSVFNPGVSGTATVTVSSEWTEYPVQEGFSVFTGSGDDSATIGAPASKFLHLLVDGKEIDPSNYTVTGESSTIITLKDSYLKTLPNGDYRVIVMFTDGQSETNLVVDAPIKVTGIALNKTTASVVVGNTVQLTATIFPDNATDKGVTWKSSNSSIATVYENGLVKGTGVGKVTITVTTKDGGYTATCEVTVGGSDNGGTHAPVPVYYTIDFYNGATLHARRSTNEGNALKTGWPENPVKTGYAFGGWYTGQNGTGTKYTPDSAIFSNLTLYAKWTSNSGGSASSSGSSSSSATSSSQQTTSTCTEPESKSETSESAVTSNTSRSEENNPQTNDSETPPALWLCILIPAVLAAAGAIGIIIWRRRRNEEK